MALFMIKHVKDNAYFSITNSNENRSLLAFKTFKTCMNFRTLLRSVHHKNNTDPYIIKVVRKQDLKEMNRSIRIQIYNDTHNIESVDEWLLMQQ